MVAHFHYVLRMGAVFTIIVGLVTWWPVLMGTNPNGLLSEVQFFSLFLGVNLTFFPMHFLGMQGIPRRYREYSPVFSYWHAVASLGSILRMLATLLLFFLWWESIVAQRSVIFVNWKGLTAEIFFKQPTSLHTNYEAPVSVLACFDDVWHIFFSRRK